MKEKTIVARRRRYIEPFPHFFFPTFFSFYSSFYLSHIYLILMEFSKGTFLKEPFSLLTPISFFFFISSYFFFELKRFFIGIFREITKCIFYEFLFNILNVYIELKLMKFTLNLHYFFTIFHYLFFLI